MRKKKDTVIENIEIRENAEAEEKVEATETAAAETTETVEASEATEATEATETTEGEAVTESAENQDETEKIGLHNWYKFWYADLALAIFVLFVAFLIVFNLPSKRFARALKSADKYYVSEAYEKAEKKYMKASKIKKLSFKGHLGVALSKQALNEEDLSKFYLEDALSMLDNETYLEGEEVTIADYFLLAPEILEKGSKEKLDVLLVAYEKFGKLSELKTALSDAYFEYGISLDNLEDALSAFDEALLYSDNASVLYTTVSETALSYINSLLVQDRYDDAYLILEKYAVCFGDDYAGVSESIGQAESLYNIKCELLKMVNDSLAPYYNEYKETFSKENVEGQEGPLFRMAAYDFSSILMLDGSDYAETLAVNALNGGSYLYSEEGFSDKFTGVATGLFTFGEPVVYEDGTSAVGYYFYYGEFKNGVRDGYGIMIAKSGDDSYVAFEGNFKDDAPNGFGALYEVNEHAFTSYAQYTKITYGNFTKGMEDDTMTGVMVLSEHPDTFFKDTYEAKEGVVAPLEGDLLEYGIVDSLPEGKVLIIRLKSVDSGYDYFATIVADEGAKLSVIGF